MKIPAPSLTKSVLRVFRPPSMTKSEETPAILWDEDKSKALTKKVLWKLDTRVLPALALVRLRCSSMPSHFTY